LLPAVAGDEKRGRQAGRLVMTAKPAQCIEDDMIELMSTAIQAGGRQEQADPVNAGGSSNQPKPMVTSANSHRKRI